jgi:putative two-component system response regulator
MHLNDRILSVDDNLDNLLILKELLDADYTFMCADSGEKALAVAPRFQPNLILLDVMMPGMDGHHTCRLLRAQPELRHTKIVMLSARTELPDRLLAYDGGAADYIGKPFDDREVLAKVRAWMQMAHRDQVEEILQEVEKTREAVGAALVSLAAFRDTETGDHLLRMRWYSEALAEQLAVSGPYREQVDEDFLRQLYRASPLHDIGKVGIADTILRKPGWLDASEFEIVKQHTIIGGEILAQAAQRMPHAEYIKMAAQIARCHHERFDGAGYPDGLSGRAIPLAARIVAVADAFDALTSDRMYRGSLTVLEAARLIEADSGSRFDPAIVDAFRCRLRDFQEAQAKFAEGLPAPYTDYIGATWPESRALGSVDHIEHMLPLDLVLS